MLFFEIIVNFFSKLWSKGRIITRIDFNSYYRKFGYPTPFIEQHKSVRGVNEYFKILKTAHNAFKERRAEILEQEGFVEQRKYSIWKMFRLIKIVSKRFFLIGMFLFIFSIIIVSFVDLRLFDDFTSLIFALVFFSVPLALVSKGAEKISEISYNKYSYRIKNELKAIRLSYLEIENDCREKMDTLCLNSLSQQERAAEWHHREMIALQEKTAEAMSAQLKKIHKENKEHNYAVEEDLRKFKEKFGIKD